MNASRTRDPTPRRRTPLTWTLAALWVAIYVASIVVGGGFRATGAWWAFGSPEPDALLRVGALVRLFVYGGDWQRLPAHGFVHGFVLHVFLNVWVWVVVGGLLEMAVGAVRTWIVFAVAVLAGGTAHVLLRADLDVGASGGVFGAVGALGVWALRVKHPLAPVAGRTALMFLLLSGVLLLVPGIGHEAHFGGLAAGALTMIALGPRRSTRPPGRAVKAVAVLLLLLFVGAGVVQALGDGSPGGKDAREFVSALDDMEDKAEKLYEKPWSASPLRRRSLGERIDRLLATPWLSAWSGGESFARYAAAWRPVVEGHVPDPFAFDSAMDDARAAWRPDSRRLRFLAGIAR